eukprot:gene50110-4093_t
MPFGFKSQKGGGGPPGMTMDGFGMDDLDESMHSVKPKSPSPPKPKAQPKAGGASAKKASIAPTAG